ncbi:S-layer homology domain-containing protein [Paenibacillus alginolyticus]|uniref:S-layer homology domain-containing protein n=1 Tax=Paenibacillus alginolyticus TaxID=59839 RepID=A0ABT4G9E4_9BACL|nr:S-layer homology domain-containing protein [Paenibacillus alginolyticus]MCY9692805.1 S-layer homology domain-containing protein [Paenibacillus alginolyticus]MEC0146126.1 S-layer homology domain-containing protein [Paenibacillus alginolyticus]
MKLFKSRKPLQVAVLTAVLFSSVSTLSSAAEASDSAVSYKQFLKDQYAISLSDSLSKGDFIIAVNRVLKAEAKDQINAFTDLQKDSPYYKAALALHEKGILSEGKLQGDQPLTQLQATFIALKAAGLKELAYTYPKHKIKAALAKVHIDYDQNNQLTLQAAQELAAAIDTGLVSSGFEADAAAGQSFANELLGKILTFQGHYKHYIGTTSDADIFSKINDTWHTEDLISSTELRAVFDEALKKNLVTGYNLKDSRFDANFDPTLSLTYGHSDITHAIQLIGLLRSENIQAKVQLEPKTSAFIYLKEWGEPTHPTIIKLSKSRMAISSPTPRNTTLSSNSITPSKRISSNRSFSNMLKRTVKTRQDLFILPGGSRSTIH